MKICIVGKNPQDCDSWSNMLERDNPNTSVKNALGRRSARNIGLPPTGSIVGLKRTGGASIDYRAATRGFQQVIPILIVEPDPASHSPPPLKGVLLERSLSVLLPVHNAQAELAHCVETVLDTAGDLTDRFEIVIIDDASTDDTQEVAYDLAKQYPQVKWMRNGSRQGMTYSVRKALEKTFGEIICVHEGDGPVEIGDLEKLWSLRNEEDLVVARHGARIDTIQDNWSERVLGRMETAPGPRRVSGFHLLRRQAMETLQENPRLMANQHEIRFRRDSARKTKEAVSKPNIFVKMRELAFGE